MSVIVPTGLCRAVADEPGGPEWLASIPARATRAAERWGLTLGEPFGAGMAAWTAPATTDGGAEVVVKLSFPHDEARHEAAALATWRGAGVVEVLGADAADWALLLRRLRPGTTLGEEQLPPAEHLAIGAELLREMAAVPIPAGAPFPDLVEVAGRLGATAAERVERLLPVAPVPVDAGLCRDAIDLLTHLPADAVRRGLAHGDLNPGNILRDDDRPGDGNRSRAWRAIDPKPVHGDLAWDPWPLLTQIGDWTAGVPAATDLAERTRRVADVTDLDPARIAAWCVARSVESGLWAADRGRWTGFRGADGDLARAGAWAATATVLGA